MPLSLLAPAPTSPASHQDAGLARLARIARNDPHMAESQQAYGLALLHAGQPSEARPYLERAASLSPTDASHQINLSATQHLLGNLTQALWHASEAHRLDLSSVIALNNIASLHYFLGEIPEAEAWWQKTIRRDPGNWGAWWNWLFVRDFLPITAEQALADRRAFSAAFEPPLKAAWPRHLNRPDPERRLRLGFTGGDFREHSSSYMWGPIFERLDRDRYEIVSYADLSKDDEVTDWFRSASNGWRDITNWPDDRVVAEIVRRDEIDVLIDLGTFSDKSHLYTHLLKPAPLSITAWGHLTGTGLDCMDGLLVDRVMLPEGTEWEVTERPCWVPYALGFTRPRADVPIVRRPEGAPLVFGYLGRVQKLDDPTVALWADLLHATPGSRLILKDVTYEYEWSRTRIAERFEAWGIAPSRLDIRGVSSRLDHLAVNNEMDVALDPLSQGGGATIVESLWMGTPTVTLAGSRMVRRVGASTVTAAGHPDWVAEDIHEYVRIAQRIASAGGPGLRASFLASAACDDVARTRAFESAVRDLWRSWCRKQKG